MGVSKLTVEQLVQTARDLTPEAKEIIRNADRKVTKTDALKISRLPPDQQQEAAARLAAGGVKPPAKPRVSKPLANSSSSTHGDEQQSEAVEGLVKEFSGYAHRFISGMKTYKNLSETFAEMSTLQITVIWDAVAAVNKALRDFSKEVKNYQSGDDKNEN